MATVPAPETTIVADIDASAGRRRRPSGEPPPLPRHLPARTGWHLAAAGLTAGLWAMLLLDATRVGVTRVDLAVLRGILDLRTSAVTTVARGVAHLGSGIPTRVLAWATIAILLLWRRFQHLVAYLFVLLSVSFIETVVANAIGRMRPAGVAIAGTWTGYAHPSRPIAGLALVLAGVTYTLVPPGRLRRRSAWVALIALGLLSASRLYLAVDHPTDVFAALVVGWSVPTLLFAWATPIEAFPISYSRRPRAHLDIGGQRGEAIRQALDQQLGLRVISAEPFGLGGSAGSTPLHLRVEREHPPGAATDVFAKLYATNHVRSDRLYKLVRSIRYGRLEDEKPFSSVRRLVEYEDHLLRLFRDLGLPTPNPLGVVEITPEREYLVLMEFLAGAEEVGATPINDAHIGQGLAAVRTMWDAGIAHRDIKPSNVLVVNDRVVLIDLAFGAVRPSPWRQAVDLANMMLTLALVCSPEDVYRIALRFFTEKDIAEAFAASRGVTIPAQLKTKLHADGRDLIGAFRQLAPARSPVAIQRWSFRRVVTLLGVVVGVLIILWGSFVYARTAGLL